MIGMIALLIFVTFYAFTTMMIAVWVLKDASTLASALFFAVTGCLWAFPAMLIIKWMMKKPEEKGVEGRP